MSINTYHNSFSSFAYTPPSAAFVGRWRNTHLIQQQKHHQSMNTRLFGYNPKSPDAKPGEILLEDDRLNKSEEDDGNNDNDNIVVNMNNNNNNNDKPILPINLTALRQTIEHTREILGYNTYDISVTLVSDSHMREINAMSRGIDAPTDVLSFCFQEEDDIVEPGVLGEVQFDMPDFYNLGDVLIDVEYVQRRCEEDRKLHIMEAAKDKSDNKNENEGLVEGEVITEQQGALESTAADSATIHHQQQQSDTIQEAKNDETADDEYEYMEIEVEEYDDRGVAPQMQYIYDPEIRIHMLLVHGMLHLVGYDHIEDDDYELMVVREDEVLAELRRRLGNDFGVGAMKALPE
jgi:rRNA maturation RNase YbeY